MKKIAIFIKTLFREEALKNCLNSIESNVDIPYRIYIADDGIVSEEKKVMYDKLRKEGNIVLELPFDTGATKSRNILLDHLKEETMVLRMDDDFEISEQTNIRAMVDVIENNKENIGLVADLERQIGNGKGVFNGDINVWQGLFKNINGILIKEYIPLNKFKYKKTPLKTRYAICDFSRNMLLINRKVFDELKWDESLRFHFEHEDFLLQIFYSQWKVAFTLDSIHLHREDIECKNIKKYLQTKDPNAKKDDLQIFKSKWRISKMIDKEPFMHRVKRKIKRILSDT